MTILVFLFFKNLFFLSEAKSSEDVRENHKHGFVKGTFKDGKPLPKNKWKLIDAKGKNLYEVDYSFSPPKVMIKKDNKTTELSLSRHSNLQPKRSSIGLINLKEHSIGFNAEDRPIEEKYDVLNYLIMYKDAGKKEITGIAIGPLRFFYDEVVENTCEPAESKEASTQWMVYEKKQQMCLAQVSYGKCTSNPGNLQWVDCNGYEDILASYKRNDLTVAMAEDFFQAPNGKKVELKIISNEKNLDRYGVTLIDSKVVNGVLWVKIEFKTECNRMRVDISPKTVWMPFERNNHSLLFIEPMC